MVCSCIAHAQDLKDAGLHGINISLDTMDADKFVRITRRKGLEKTLENIHLALSVGFPSVKVNTVVMRGFNENELIRFCEMTKDNKLTVRFIEFMPFDAHQIWETGEHFASAASMIDQIKTAYPKIEDASGTRTEHHIFKVPGLPGQDRHYPCLYPQPVRQLLAHPPDGGGQHQKLPVFRCGVCDPGPHARQRR